MSERVFEPFEVIEDEPAIHISLGSDAPVHLTVDKRSNQIILEMMVYGMPRTVTLQTDHIADVTVLPLEE